MKKATSKADQVITQEARDAIISLINSFQADIKISMRNSPQTGNIYPRAGTTPHIASSKGNPPRPDEGILINSIFKTMTGLLKGEVFTNVGYAEILEDENNLDRPFMSKRSIAGKQLRKNSKRLFGNIKIGRIQRGR
tara:strand:- start:1083 stop:1493 length:411 start_codon:yes stop_codon:yes gene_type:complete